MTKKDPPAPKEIHGVVVNESTKKVPQPSKKIRHAY
jgi:hypothetical protein